jgi:hypothetical protein
VLRYKPVLKIDFFAKNRLIEIVPSLGTKLYSIRLYTSLERMLAQSVCYSIASVLNSVARWPLSRPLSSNLAVFES